MAETVEDPERPRRSSSCPDLEAGCSLADGCPAPLFAEWLKKYPGHTVVSYINCSAAVKALSDVIVTSSSAPRSILRQLPRPGRLRPGPQPRGAGSRRSSAGSSSSGRGRASSTRRSASRSSSSSWRATPKPRSSPTPSASGASSRTPPSSVDVRPPPARRTSSKQAFIVATEEGILHQMRRAAPGKTLIPAPPDADCACNTCPHMKRNTLEKLYALPARPRAADRGGRNGACEGEEVDRPDARDDDGALARARRHRPILSARLPRYRPALRRLPPWPGRRPRPRLFAAGCRSGARSRAPRRTPWSPREAR